MLMPVKMTSVFKSRWKALLWAGGVLFFAWQIAGSLPSPDDKTKNSEQAAESNGAQKIPATWN